MENTRLRSTLAGALGNVIEWYDFSLYGYFSIVIGKLFFPASDPVSQLILVFGVFAMGFVMRPLGAVFFGRIGDKMGRKPALILSVLLMTLSTFLIGCLPSYDSAGELATLSLLLLRLLQGVSAGGETGGAYTYVLEFFPEKKRGRIGGFLMSMIVFGILLGSFAPALATLIFSKDTLFEWGWRVPFWISALLGTFVFLLRWSMDETPQFEKAKRGRILSRVPIREVIRSHKTPLVLTAGITSLGAAAFYYVFIFYPAEITALYGFPLHKGLFLNTLLMALNMALIPFFGFLSDKIGRMKVLFAGTAAFLFLSYPVSTLSPASFRAAIFVHCLFGIFTALYEGPIAAAAVKLSPAPVRYSVIAFGYNLGFCLFGGFGPLIAASLLKTGKFEMSSLYLVFSSIAAPLTLFIKKTGKL